MTEKILFVDDEVNILYTLKRSLGRQFQIEVALGPENGLMAIANHGPYAVVVSDMRMPGMDGIQFLSKVKECSPETVRVILTGQADLSTAIRAVNEGSVFRFLTKPCPPDVLQIALEVTLQQYRLITAERDLLERTLVGSVAALIEILGLVHPMVFSRSVRIRRYIRHLVIQLKLSSGWQYELAALLSQVGFINLPPTTLDKISRGKELAADEQEMLASHPAVASRLLQKIPRLELISQIVYRQQKSYSEYPEPADPRRIDEVALGAQMLRAAIDLDQLVKSGFSHESALKEMSKREGEYNRTLLAALENVEAPELHNQLGNDPSELNTMIYANCFWPAER